MCKAQTTETSFWVLFRAANSVDATSQYICEMKLKAVSTLKILRVYFFLNTAKS